MKKVMLTLGIGLASAQALGVEDAEKEEAAPQKLDKSAVKHPPGGVTGRPKGIKAPEYKGGHKVRDWKQGITHGEKVGPDRRRQLKAPQYKRGIKAPVVKDGPPPIKQR